MSSNRHSLTTQSKVALLLFLSLLKSIIPPVLFPLKYQYLFDINKLILAQGTSFICSNFMEVI